MRRGITLAILTAAVLAVPLAAQSRRTENTVKLDDPDARPPASIEQMAWMTGVWQGTGLGGTVSETWGPPEGGTMVGTFSAIDADGSPSFYELLLLTEEEGSLLIRLKHFNPDITGWEEKDDHLTFRLVKIEDGAAYFSGLTYKRLDDGRLAIYLAFKRGEALEELEFYFSRVATPAVPAAQDEPGAAEPGPGTSG